MSYATLMVYVEADGASERRIRLAARLADKFSAMLIGVSGRAMRPLFDAEGVVIEKVTDAESQEMQAKLAGKEDWFRGIAGAEHRKLEWRWALDFPTDVLVREARSADLVIIGQDKGPGDAYDSLDGGGALLKTGRPMLVVPNSVDVLRADHVVIGWKDTREARRAVQDAIPFMHEATRVTVVEVCDPGQERDASQRIDDVARYLTRHRISGGLRVVLHQEGTGAAQLIRLAQDEGADLLVTGAYGHSRLGEWIFGGVTRDLLVSSPICCLMSH